MSKKIVIPLSSLVATIMYIVGPIYKFVQLSILCVLRRLDGQSSPQKNDQKSPGPPEWV